MKATTWERLAGGRVTCRRWLLSRRMRAQMLQHQFVDAVGRLVSGKMPDAGQDHEAIGRAGVSPALNKSARAAVGYNGRRQQLPADAPMVGKVA